MNPQQIAGLLGWILLAASTNTLAADLDQSASNIGFSLKTRWGQTLQGRFPQYQGQITTLADGKHQVHLQLSAKNVEILGNETYTRFLRGPRFFDADRYDTVEFLSDAYPAEIMRSGGALAGELTIHGRRQREVFTLSPANCQRPAVECDVVATGSIRRSRYGINRWSFALSDRVRFALRVRVLGALDR